MRYINFADIRYRGEFVVLLIFATSAFISTSIATISLLLCVALWLVNIRVYLSLLTAKVFIPVWGLLLFLLCHAGYIFWQDALPASAVIKDYSRWGQLLLFVPLACVLYQHKARVHWFMLVWFAGFLVRLITHDDFWALIQQTRVERSGFGLPVIAFALYAATFLFAMLVFLPAFNRFLLKQLRSRYWVGWLLWLVVFCTVLAAFIASQSRGAYLALLGAIVLLLVFIWQSGCFSLRGKVWLIAPIFGLLMIAGLYIQTLEHRLNTEQEIVQQVLHEGLSDLPKSSISLRLAVWQFGLQQWQQKPLLGWGAGQAKKMIAASGLNELKTMDGSQYLIHFHNTYVQLLVNFGIVGLVFFSWMLVVLVSVLQQIYRKQFISVDVYICFIGTLLMVAIWCIFDVRMIHADWCFYWNTVFGLIYSHCLIRYSAQNAC